MPNLSLPFLPAHRGRLLVALAVLAGLVVGCTATPPATSPPAPFPTASPTSGPTATPLLTVTPTPGAEVISHPMGAHEIVLRLEHGGGLAPMEFFATHAPEFTLYGDGTVVFRPPVDMADPNRESLVRFVRGQLDEEAVQALLRYALGTGRLLNARDRYDQSSCADCGFTTFTLNAAGLQKTVVIDALGMIDEAGPDAADRGGFAVLQETLTGFDERARNGELGEATLYDPTHYRVFLFEGMGIPDVVADWPWSDVTPDDFAARAEDWRRQAVLDREHVSGVTDVPSGGIFGATVRDEGGSLWQIVLRPLLPDELVEIGLH